MVAGCILLTCSCACFCDVWPAAMCAMLLAILQVVLCMLVAACIVVAYVFLCAVSLRDLLFCRLCAF